MIAKLHAVYHHFHDMTLSYVRHVSPLFALSCLKIKIDFCTILVVLRVSVKTHTACGLQRLKKKCLSVLLFHLFLRGLSGHDRTLTSAWKPFSCFCVRPFGPGTSWPFCWCSLCACSWPYAVHFPPCCLSSSGSVWRCPRTGPARCGGGTRMSR